MLYLVAKPSHVGADVDGLAYTLHGPIACGWRTRGLCFLTDIVRSHLSVVRSGTFQGMRSPQV
jgi:hypothetical protein